MPLPYHAIRAEIEIGEREFQAALNGMVLVLNWLKLGQPSRAPKHYVVNQQLNGQQKGILQRLRRLASDWVDLPAVTA